MTEIDVTTPWILGLLSLLPFFGYWSWQQLRQPQTGAGALVLPSLWGRIGHVATPTPTRLWIRLGLSAMAFGLAMLSASDVVLLASHTPSEQRGRPIMLVVDSSLTMTLEDLSPKARVTRMEATQAFLSAWIRQRPENAFGLIIFGSQAAVLSRPTADSDFVLAQLSRVQVGTLGNNTALGDALGLALHELARVEKAEQRPTVVLVSDGEASNSGTMEPMNAVAIAQSRGIPIHTIQFGSPRAPSDNQPSLREISTLTEGEHWNVQNSALLGPIMARLEALTPLVDLPPQRLPSQWLSPWILMLAVLLALASLVTGRDRTASLIEPALRPWAIPEQRVPKAHRLLRMSVMGLLICALLGACVQMLRDPWAKILTASQSAEQPSQFVAVLPLIKGDQTDLFAMRLSLLHLAEAYPEKPVAVVVVADTTGLALPFTRDPAVLRRLLDQLIAQRDGLNTTRGQSESFEPIHKAVAKARQYVQEDPQSVVLVFGSLDGQQFIGAETIAGLWSAERWRALFGNAPAPSRDLPSGEGLRSWQALIVLAGLLWLLLWSTRRLGPGSLDTQETQETRETRVARTRRGLAVVVALLFAVAGLAPPDARAEEFGSTRPIPTPLRAQAVGTAPSTAATGLTQRMQQGRQWIEKQHPEKAITVFQEALILADGPDRTAVLFNLGLALSYAQQWETAAALWRDYLRRFPEDVEARKNLSLVLKKRAAAQAAQGEASDLRGRRGRIAQGLVQTDGAGATEADLLARDAESSNQARGAGESRRTNPWHGSPPSDQTISRRWPITETQTREAELRLERLTDEPLVLLQGLLGQRHWPPPRQRQEPALEPTAGHRP